MDNKYDEINNPDGLTPIDTSMLYASQELVLNSSKQADVVEVTVKSLKTILDKLPDDLVIAFWLQVRETNDIEIEMQVRIVAKGNQIVENVIKSLESLKNER